MSQERCNSRYGQLNSGQQSKDKSPGELYRNAKAFSIMSFALTAWYAGRSVRVRFFDNWLPLIANKSTKPKDQAKPKRHGAKAKQIIQRPNGHCHTRGDEAAPDLRHKEAFKKLEPGARGIWTQERRCSFWGSLNQGEVGYSQHKPMFYV